MLIVVRNTASLHSGLCLSGPVQNWTLKPLETDAARKINEIKKKSLRKFIKIFYSKSILKVERSFSKKKVVFFQNLDFLFRKFYSKFDGF